MSRRFSIGSSTIRPTPASFAHVEMLPERPGKYDLPTESLPPALSSMLAGRGIQQLYSHQVAALEHARARRDFVVVTGTASGKTLCYHLPILEACLADPEARACTCFPPRRCQDQLKNLLELLNGKEQLAPLFDEPLPDASAAELLAAITAGVYDGDTPTAQRRRIKAEANLVLSNPDMLHASILPYHPKWAGSSASCGSWCSTKCTPIAASLVLTSPACCGG